MGVAATVNIHDEILSATTLEEVELARLRVRLFLDDPAQSKAEKDEVRREAESLAMTRMALEGEA